MFFSLKNTLLVLVLLLQLNFSLVSSQSTLKVGTIVNRINPFFSSKDVPILQGIQLWARWTNERGGVLLGGVPYNISVVTREIPDGNDTIENIQEAARALAEDDLVDIIIPCFSTQRVAWAYSKVIEINPNILMCGVGASVDTPAFSGGESYYSTSRGIQNIVNVMAELMLELSPAKTFSILYPTESPFYVTLASTANATIKSDPGASVLFYREYISDRENVDIGLLSESLRQLSDVNADTFWFVNNFGDDIATMNLVMRAQGYAPEAALIGASMESYSTEFFNQANFWISASTYHPDLQIGVSGIHMGTMSEYADYFFSVYGYYPDISWTVVATACGVMLQVGIEATEDAGLNWKNATDVLNSFKALNDSSDLAQTFYGSVKIDNRNANTNAQNYAVQMVNGDWKLIDAKSAIYPAPWPWAEDDDSDSLDVGTTVGIIIGSIAGACILLLICLAIVALILYLVKLKFYHMIVLPKGNPDL